jgi:ABC-type glycerol-3-phosphate transport system substrate-binding protein
MVVPVAAHPSTGAADRSLQLWWWGEDEAIGMSRWLEDTARRFEADTGIRIEPRLLATDDVVAHFTAAAAEGAPPDIQYLWNGIYHMENVWQGYVAPLNGLVARNVLNRSGATQLSIFGGHQYRAGFYRSGFGMAYNKHLLDRAGLDPDDPPRTWNALLHVCDRLKASGIVPFGGGAKDGYFGDWYLTNALSQNLNAPGDAFSLFIGHLDWREPAYLEPWARLLELSRLGFLNDDICELDHFAGLSRFDEGRCAMSLYVTPSLANAQKRLGADKVGFMGMPVFGTGRLAGVPILYSHGFGIPSGARDQRNAARFIEYMHTKERLQAMWLLSGQIPTDEAFDPSVIDDPLIRGLYDTWMVGLNAPYIGDLMPTRFWTDAMFVASRRILAGEINAEQAADLSNEVTEAWKRSEPDVVSNYVRWGRGLEL